MITDAIHLIEEVLLPLGAWGIFLASLLEEIIAPIPSAFIQLGAGFLFLEGGIDSVWFFNLFFIILIPVSLGVAFGSLFVYMLAYWLGKPFLLRWGRYLGVSWGDIERAQKKFKGTYADETTLFILRAIPAVPSVAVSALCGLIRFNIIKYIVLTFLGTLIRASILAVIGWQVGGLYIECLHIIEHFEKGILVLTAVSIIGFIGYQRYKRK